jgi:signal transduction histidine kinase
MRTPLNGIISNAELLATNEEMPLPSSEIAIMGREISQSGQRLERLIENFLAYAQIELLATDAQGVKELRDARLPLSGDLARRTATDIASRMDRSIDLSVDVVNAPLAIGDEYFKKIVTELVQNAFKYSTAGSPVRVRLGVNGADAELSVRDAGRGFTQEQIQRIGAYVQLDRKMQDVEGLGLGLAISRKLAELHGGSLSVESGQGIGSTVTVRLPLTK